MSEMPLTLQGAWVLKLTLRKKKLPKEQNKGVFKSQSQPQRNNWHAPLAASGRALLQTQQPK